jgi:hypothetical protein
MQNYWYLLLLLIGIMITNHSNDVIE